ncbi:MAG TPA: AI-2E family transporter [Methylomirabilota bacterium]|jgi:predicted PurR-regulated permease PerM
MGGRARGVAIQNVSFLLLVAVTTLAFVALIGSFLMPVFWAAVLATIFFPLQRRYVAGLGGRKSLAALATILTIIGLVLAPLFLVGLAMSREAMQLYEQVTSGAIDLQAPLGFLRRITPLASDYVGRFGVDLDGMAERLSTAAVAGAQFVASRALGIGQDVLRFTALFFLMLYLLFFFLRDGSRLVATLIRMLPLGDERERQLLAKFTEVSRATIKGTLVVGIVQGAIGGGLFWALGIPAPVFWGAVMAILSVLPVVGPGLIWGPAAVILLGLGEIVKGIVLIAAGVVIIGLVDNVLRPILVGRDTQMPDYLVLLATLGGLAVFGISGLVIGPVIAAFFLVVWEMFAQEHAEPTATPDERPAADVPEESSAA